MEPSIGIAPMVGYYPRVYKTRAVATEPTRHFEIYLRAFPNSGHTFRAHAKLALLP